MKCSGRSALKKLSGRGALHRPLLVLESSELRNCLKNAQNPTNLFTRYSAAYVIFVGLMLNTSPKFVRHAVCSIGSVDPRPHRAWRLTGPDARSPVASGHPRNNKAVPYTGHAYAVGRLFRSGKDGRYCRLNLLKSRQCEYRCWQHPSHSEEQQQCFPAIPSLLLQHTQCNLLALPEDELV